MPYEMIIGPGPTNVPIFVCDVCRGVKFEKNKRLAPTWQRCKKCGAEYVTAKAWTSKPPWRRTA
jgi:hypothetical protein